MAAKFIFVTGGVTSSLGKGITAAALGRLLKSRGLKVAMQKFDPYININPGMMSPLQHGEVFVTDDGGECDLDLGHYERFINESLSVECDVTSGQIYHSVINKERKGDYNGVTVQVIPHITNEIKRAAYRVANKSNADVVIVEIGGTVGDIESQPFLEAIRQMRWDLGPHDCLYLHVALVPYLVAAGELKTKPAQHSVKILRSLGIQPDIVICRCEVELGRALREKIALFCNIEPTDVIPNYDVDTIYEVPHMLQEAGLDTLVCQKMDIETEPADLNIWDDLVSAYKNPKRHIRIALVGKYTELHDAYSSILEAIKHAGIANETDVEITWVAADKINSYDDAKRRLEGVDGILVPSGFGERGMSGMMFTAQYAREYQIPYFGIGIGMQLAVIEFARHVCLLLEADTTEQNPSTPYPVIDLMSDYKELHLTSGDTMRLGRAPCLLREGSIPRSCYGVEEIAERHRHRYELNPEFVPQLEAAGLKAVGVNPDLRLVEIVELSNHPWFVGTQFQPEFTSRPNRPHPLFVSFIHACNNYHETLLS